MATDDQQILVTGTAAAPASWVVPGNGQVRPRTVFAHYDGSGSSSAFQPALKVISDGGVTVGVYPCVVSVVAGGSADVSWFPGGELEEAAAGPAAGVLVEQHFCVASAGTPTVFTTTLQTGRSYVVTVQGTYTNANAALTQGTPNANAMFPTSEPGRVSTQVGTDAECTFAAVAGQPLGHNASFKLSLDGGTTFNHVEPAGGPFSTPQTNYFYTYNITGAGNALQAQIFDSFYPDNYGELLVTLQTVGGGSSGGGGGSLLPDPSQTSNGSWLRTTSGTAVWDATPQVAETDMTLSDVTTQNVSTTKHGFAPKAPNDATQFLNGTGAYSTPAGTSPLTTKGDVFGFSTVNARIPIGSDTQVLTADSAQTLGLKWAAASPLTTKGDLYTFGTANTRLAVGSNSQVLLADSAQSTGLRWGAVPAGSGGAMTQICQSVLGGAQATFDTNTILGGNIPGSYNHLLLVFMGAITAATTNDVVKLTLNNDSTAAHYNWSNLTSNAGNTTITTAGGPDSSITIANIPGTTATPANTAGQAEVFIDNYAGTTFNKNLRSNTGLIRGTTAANNFLLHYTGQWLNTAAVTRITLTPNSGSFATGSTFYLYGIT